MQHYQAQSYTPYLNHGFTHSEPTYSLPVPARRTMDNIGEGDIATVLFPDGSTRYFFVPARNPAQIQTFNPNTPAYCHPYWLTNSGVWFVRSISNAVPLSVFNKFLQEFNVLSHSEPPNFFRSSQENSGAYQLKFHHDAGTSTSDLYCFCPVYSPFTGAQQHPYYASQQFPHFVQQPSPFVINSPPFAVQPPPSYAVQPLKPMSNVGTNITTSRESKAVQVNLPSKENDTHGANMSTSNIPDGKSRASKSSDRDVHSACTRKTCEHMMVISDDEIATHSKGKKKSKCPCAKLRTSNKSCTTYNTQSTTYMVPSEKMLQTSMEDVKLPISGKKASKEIWIAVNPDSLSLPGTSRTERDDDNVLKLQSAAKSSSKAPINITTKYIPKGKEYNAEHEIWSVTSLVNRSNRIISKTNNAKGSLHCSGTTFCNSAVKPNETVIWTAVNPLLGMEIGSSISALDLCESVSTY